MFLADRQERNTPEDYFGAAKMVEAEARGELTGMDKRLRSNRIMLAEAKKQLADFRRDRFSQSVPEEVIIEKIKFAKANIQSTMEHISNYKGRLRYAKSLRAIGVRLRKRAAVRRKESAIIRAARAKKVRALVSAGKRK